MFVPACIAHTILYLQDDYVQRNTVEFYNDHCYIRNKVWSMSPLDFDMATIT